MVGHAGDCRPVEALFLVADGVGGANAGEVASGMLVEMFWQWFTTGSYVEFRPLQFYIPITTLQC